MTQKSTVTTPRRLSPSKIFLGFAALRLAIILSMIYINIPPVLSHDRFYFHHGGDQDYYFEYGEILAAGTYNKIFAVNMGHPAVMALGIRISAAETFGDILTWLVLVNGFILGGLSVVLVGQLALKLTGNGKVAALASGVWAIMPVLLWLAFWPYPNGEWLQAPHVPGSAWLNGGIPDGPSVFFGLLALYFLMWALEDRRARWAIFCGLSLGIMVVYKIHIAMIIPLVFLIIVMQRRWLTGLWVGLAFIVGYLPQVTYNYLSKLVVAPDSVINPWLPGYLYFGVIDASNGRISAQFSPLSGQALLTNFQAMFDRFGIVTLLALLIALVIIGWGLWHTIRHLGWSRAILIFGAVPAAAGINLFSAYVLADPIRFFLPVLPFATILGVWLGAVLLSRLPKLAKQPAENVLTTTGPDN